MSENILYVDDDEGCRDFIKELLTGEGYNVTTAVGGSDGSAKLEEKGNFFDLVITGIVSTNFDWKVSHSAKMSKSTFVKQSATFMLYYAV